MKYGLLRGLYKAPPSAYNAPPISKGLRGSKGLGVGEVAQRRDLRAVLTEDDPFMGFLPSGTGSFILIIVFIRCISRRLACYIARVSRYGMLPAAP